MKIPRKQGERGQSLVEFAITLPILVLIMSGLMDLGRAYYTFIALEEAVAEAALYLAISPDCPDPGILTKCNNPNNALYRAVTSGNDEFGDIAPEWNIPYDAAAVAAGWDDPFPLGCSSIGCTVLVQVTYDFEILTPGMQLFADVIILRTQAQQIIVFLQQ